MSQVDQSVSFTTLIKCDPFKTSAKPTTSSSLHFALNPKSEALRWSSSAAQGLMKNSPFNCWMPHRLIPGQKLLIGAPAEVFEAFQNNQRSLGHGNNHLRLSSYDQNPFLSITALFIPVVLYLGKESSFKKFQKKDIAHGRSLYFFYKTTW